MAGVIAKNTNNHRIVYYDILNILACIAVVFLHHNVLVWQYDDTAAWRGSLCIEVLFYYAVPLFLMLSGATLLNYRKKYDTKTFFKKRFTKILIPFIFWSIIMFIWKISLGEMHLAGIRSTINVFLNNEEMGIYYFLFLILGIYLSMPIFSKIIEKDEKNGGKKVLWYAVFVMFFSQSLLPVIFKILGLKYNTSISSQISAPLIYVFLGYLLSTTNFKKKNRMILYISAFLACIIRYIGVLFYSSIDGATNTIFMDMTQFPAVILSSAVFVFVKTNTENISFNEKISKNLSKISGCSFGVYLIHMIIMKYEMDIFGLNIHSAIWRLLCPFLTYIISVCIVFLLKKIPYINRIVP